QNGFTRLTQSITLDSAVHHDERIPGRFRPAPSRAPGPPVTTPDTTTTAATSSSAVHTSTSTTPGPRKSLGPVGLVLAGGVSVQFGAALAVSLMPRAGALGVVTLRLIAAAVVLLVVCRPR